MYRYRVDNAVTYTAEDLVLFKESPFACWMERLTLENPDHGVAPDPGSEPPGVNTRSQADLADTLRREGRRVSLIDWEQEEPLRRAATLEAMRHGVDFIVDGQLAVGPLSGTANLLMRSSGFSELGSYLYVPCDTQGKTNLHTAFRLCFLADLLHGLQGQLPPQLVIIRPGNEVVPLPTDDHIYLYRAIKKRFMDAQRDFRKHRMPDPAESSHFGRWALCANEMIKQRIVSGEQADAAPQASEPAVSRPLGQTLEDRVSAYDLDVVAGTAPDVVSTVQGTLAEQARRLAAEASAGRGSPDPVSPDRDGASSAAAVPAEPVAKEPVPESSRQGSPPPSPRLRQPRTFSSSLITNAALED